MLALSRQNLPALRTPEHANNENLCARGGYVLRDTPNPRAVLVASGSEVTLAVNAAEQLAAQNIAVQVVSMPSLSLFRQQDRTYCERILPLHLPRLCIEAASPLGWGELLRPQDTAIGMTTFGASGKGSEVMARFGFTVENIVTIAQKLVEREV